MKNATVSARVECGVQTEAEDILQRLGIFQINNRRTRTGYNPPVRPDGYPSSMYANVTQIKGQLACAVREYAKIA